MQTCWQPSPVHKCDAVIRLINSPYGCVADYGCKLHNRYRYFFSDYDLKQYVKTFFKTSCFCFFESTLKIFLDRSQLRSQREGTEGSAALLGHVF